MIRRISVSLLVVSSNPGVSINVTFRPSNSNGSETWTTFVQELSPFPMRNLDPLARFMNCEGRYVCLFYTQKLPNLRHTVVFPLPVAPITLNYDSRKRIRFLRSEIWRNIRNGDAFID